MTYEEYRAGAIALAQSVDWGRPPRPGQPWPVRLVPLSLAIRLRGTGLRLCPVKYGMIRVEDDFGWKAYFEKKEKTQDREKLK